MSDQRAEPEVSLIDRLEQTNLVEVNRSPTIEDLKFLADKGHTSIVEYGCQALKTTEGQEVTQFTKSELKEVAIFEPEIPGRLKGKLTGAVFIHNHPILPSEQIGDEKTLHVFPSEADFWANFMSRMAAGYMNIASIHGLLMNIGIEPMSREEDLTRRLKIKAGAKETGNETNIWRILSGEKAGSVLPKRIPVMVGEKFSMGSADVILASKTEYIYHGFNKRKDGEDMPVMGFSRYFLLVGWDKLKSVETNFGGLSNLFFGDGVSQLVEALKIDAPHDQNLSTVTQASGAYTKRRGK